MKLNTTTIGIPLAIVLLVGAAGVVMATSGSRPRPTHTVPAAASPTPTPSRARRVKPVKKDTALTDVLDDLVTKGTITAAQKTAILDAVKAERTVRREARRRPARPPGSRPRRTVSSCKGFLADGVITKEEFDKLPADSPLRTMTGLMDDGKITTEELKTLGRGFLGGKGQGQGGGWFGKDKTTGRLAVAGCRHQRLTPDHCVSVAGDAGT